LSAKVVDAYAAAHVSPTSMPSVKAFAAKPPAAKEKATTRKVAATTGPDKKGPAKKPSTKTTTSAPARKEGAAGPASRGVATKMPSTRRSKTAAPASPMPVTSTGPEPHAAAVESAPLHRLIALEKQVAGLTSRLVAVESGNRAAGNNAAATVAKPTAHVQSPALARTSPDEVRCRRRPRGASPGFPGRTGPPERVNSTC